MAATRVYRFAPRMVATKVWPDGTTEFEIVVPMSYWDAYKASGMVMVTLYVAEAGMPRWRDVMSIPWSHDQPWQVHRYVAEAPPWGITAYFFVVGRDKSGRDATKVSDVQIVRQIDTGSQPVS